MPLRYRRVVSSGITFVFKYEEDPPDMLHIFARHRKHPHQAIQVWFSASPSEHRWNGGYERFEAAYGEIGIHWFWIKEPTVVMISSCFDERKEP